MASKHDRQTFMSGVHYLNRQQYYGESWGALRMINYRFKFSKNLYSKDLYAHYGCVNAIEFSNDGEWLVSGGDDKRVLIWNVDKTLSGSYQPKAMKGEHNSNIFCLGFSTAHTINDEQVILHDVNTADILDVFIHDEAVYGLSVDPVNENVFASACDDGRVLIWDIRQTSNDPFVLAGCSSAYHAVMYNPVEPRFIATANAKDGVCLWDIRKPKVCLMKYGGSLLAQSAMSVRFNSTGTHLLALRRRLPPVLYELTSVLPAAEFDHQEYYNSCTMKSCCFAGDKDEYVLSGSDDFKLYVWKIPDAANSKKGFWVSKAHLVLRGHRSIVNQVRYNNTYGILASSGVEKIVKLWSTFPISCSEDNSGYVSSTDGLRKVYSHEEYISLVLESGQFMTHDYSHHSVQEDPRMMAFFDSLVQRDIEGWTSDSSDATDLLNTCCEVQSSGSPSASFSSSSDDESQQNEVVKISAKKNTSAPQSISATQAAQSLSYIIKRALANSHCASLPNDVEESGDPSLDRISQLIAKKRHEQMLRTARATMKLSGRNCKLIGIKLKEAHSDSCKLVTGENENSETNVSTVKGSGIDHEIGRKAFNLLLKAKDKRKMLRKKRARLNKDATFGEHSSDSDENKELTEVNTNVNGDKEESEVKTDPVVTSKSEENETGAMSNGAIHKKDSTEIDTVLPNGTQNVLNGTDVTTVATNSNSFGYFPAKSTKRNSRNYRKRSAEDLDDD
ncbi:DDB1- and CUL4-associated factor 5, partial [Stegodyphus mimosarum]